MPVKRVQSFEFYGTDALPKLARKGVGRGGLRVCSVKLDTLNSFLLEGLESNRQALMSNRQHEFRSLSTKRNPTTGFYMLLAEQTRRPRKDSLQLMKSSMFALERIISSCKLCR